MELTKPEQSITGIGASLGETSQPHSSFIESFEELACKKLSLLIVPHEVPMFNQVGAWWIKKLVSD